MGLDVEIGQSVKNKYDDTEDWLNSGYLSRTSQIFFLEEKFKILEYTVSRQGKSYDTIEERIQSVKKILSKDHSHTQKKYHLVEDEVWKID